MNEIFDKLIIKILITSFVLLVVFLYRYMQVALVNKSKKFSLKAIFPERNTAHAFHIFSRVLGIAMVLSEFSFFLSDGLFMALFDFFLYSFFLIILYGLSIYAFESIALYNFSFEDEIYKRKNIAFSAVTFGISLSAAYIVREIFYISQGSLINLFFLWLFTTVLFGFALKSYLLLTDRHLNQVVLQQDNFAAISHVGFSWSWASLLLLRLTQK